MKLCVVSLITALVGAGIAAAEPLQPVGASDESPAEARTDHEPQRRRDPFRPFTIDLGPGDQRAPTPLQRYELQELRVTGDRFRP